MIRLTCRRCKGTGQIPNVAYEACRTMQSEEAKRYFYMDQEHKPEETNEKGDACAVHEKTASCPQCDGEGSLTFDEDEWELSVVPEEDEEG